MSEISLVEMANQSSQHVHGAAALNRPSAFKGVDIPSYGDIVNCIHCGMCLPVCPTYALTLREKSSPRGRIQLIKAVADGDLEISQGFVDEMYFCLNCQACMTACPAGVKYGDLVEAARAQIEINGGRRPWKQRLIKKFFLEYLFTNDRRLKFFARVLRFLKVSGLQGFAKKAGLIRIISKKLHDLDELSPTIPAKFSDQIIPEVVEPEGAPRGRVGFLTGCVMNLVFPDVNCDSVAVLRHNGYTVVTPRHQSCCGSLHGHNGDLETGRKLARQMIDAFEEAIVDYVIVNAAGCSSFMKHYDHLLAEDGAYREKAKAFVAKVRDITEFLAQEGMKQPTKALGQSVTYHEPCHLLHAQKIKQEPREVLKQIPGVELIPLAESDWCCGSAGIYNVTQFEASMQLLKRKMDNIAATKAQVVATGNPGCMLQLQVGARRFGVEATPEHPVTLLRRAYGISSYEGPKKK